MQIFLHSAAPNKDVKIVEYKVIMGIQGLAAPGEIQN